MRRAEATTRLSTPATPPYSMKINGGPGMYSIGGLYSIKQDTRRGSGRGAGEGSASLQAYPVNGTAQADAYASTPPLTPWGAPLATPRDEKGPYEEFINRRESLYETTCADTSGIKRKVCKSALVIIKAISTFW